ncbi:BA75_04415T0 [Komagataella pastoris]|uniref:BA75_04415T0 n=1 Tax=Komagataella pastoris TaxID=4922 RepID=A0A1B2JI61_PICPA|nr:BA75_04415T0 [Komagataella pastoris]
MATTNNLEMTRPLIAESLLQSFGFSPRDKEFKSQRDSTLITTENIQNNLNQQSQKIYMEVGHDRVTTKVYQHMREYPIARSYIDNVTRVPQPRFVRAVIHDALFSETMVPYTVRLDTSLNNLLDQLDQRIPQLKVLRMRDIRDVLTGPFARTYTSLNRFSPRMSSPTTGTRSDVIVEPTRTITDHILDVYHNEKSSRPRDTLIDTFWSSMATSRKISAELKNSFRK